MLCGLRRSITSTLRQRRTPLLHRLTSTTTTASSPSRSASVATTSAPAATTKHAAPIVPHTPNHALHRNTVLRVGSLVALMHVRCVLVGVVESVERGMYEIRVPQWTETTRVSHLWVAVWSEAPELIEKANNRFPFHEFFNDIPIPIFESIVADLYAGPSFTVNTLLDTILKHYPVDEDRDVLLISAMHFLLQHRGYFGMLTRIKFYCRTEKERTIFIRGTRSLRRNHDMMVEALQKRLIETGARTEQDFQQKFKKDEFFRAEEPVNEEIEYNTEYDPAHSHIKSSERSAEEHGRFVLDKQSDYATSPKNFPYTSLDRMNWRPENPIVQSVLNLLARVATFENYEPLSSSLKNLLRKLGYKPLAVEVFALMKDLGAWGKFTNRHRHRAVMQGRLSVPPRKSVPDLDVDLDQELREDWPSERVFAIDAISTHDVDDAISVDRDKNGDVWIHVHVADVSSVPMTQFDAPLERFARKRGTSHYLPEGYFPMFPQQVVTTLGLDQKQNGQRPLRCMTFSCRINEAGALVESRIAVTRLPRIKRITYTVVQSLIDGAQPATVAADDRRDLLLMHTLAQRRKAYRQGRGAISMSIPKAHVSLTPSGRINLLPSLPQTDAQRLVEEMMLLAGEASAEFANQHSLSVPFRVQGAPKEELLNFYDGVDSFLQAIKEAEQKKDYATLHQCASLMVSATSKTLPSRHFSVALDMYCRTTSPLRRYSDLAAHLQFKAILRKHEPLSIDAMSGINEFINDLNVEAKFVSNRTHRHWAVVHLHRVFNLDSERRGVVLRGTVLRKFPTGGKANLGVLLHGFNVIGTVVSDVDSGLEPGDDVMVTLQDINFNTYIVAVRLNLVEKVDK